MSLNLIETVTPLVSTLQNSTALIKPVEMNNQELCAAHVCKIHRSKAKKINWVQCDYCLNWYHMYCLKLTTKKLSKSFICDECKNCD